MDSDTQYVLTKNDLSQSRKIARGSDIREWERLVNQYGGRKKNWVKKSSPVLLLNGRKAEIHWYECKGMGRFEEKIVWLE